MADTRSLTSLFEAISHQDWEGTRTSALEIAAKEEAKGNRGAAQKLRGALNGFGTNGHSHPQVYPTGAFSASKALVRCNAPKRLHDVALKPGLRKVLSEIIDEWHVADELKAAGLPRRSRLLFHGPPGCGKTITASALGRELGFPAFVVQFNALIGPYLGQTALNLREIFRFAANNRCVLILDEIDVLGKRRGSQVDVGELDRIVVGLMQELDLSEPQGLIIGASNLSSQLDHALWRRFDIQLEFPKPTGTETLTFARKLAKCYSVELSASIKKQIQATLDFASTEKIVLEQARRNILKLHLGNGGKKAEK